MLIQYIIKPYPWCTVVSMEEVWKWLDRHQPFIDYNPPFVIWLFGVFVPEHKTRIGQHIEEPTIQIYTNSIKKTLNTDIYLFIRLLPHSLLVNLTPLLITLIHVFCSRLLQTIIQMQENRKFLVKSAIISRRKLLHPRRNILCQDRFVSHLSV